MLFFFILFVTVDMTLHLRRKDKSMSFIVSVCVMHVSTDIYQQLYFKDNTQISLYPTR